MTLPPRAQALLHETPPLVKAHFEAARNPYHPERNPGGFINLGTAENHLMWDLLRPRLSAARAFRESDTHYAESWGTREFRHRVAGLLARRAGRNVDPEHIMVASGASAVLNNLFHCLCGPGEGVLVPAPYYAGFDHDLATRADVVRVPVPLSSARDFSLEPSDWEGALAAARKRGIRVRAILLTNPNNPLGRTIPEATVRQALAFARRNGLHVVSDELYAESYFAPPRPTSLLGLPEADADDVHVVYGFAKDFALSGFKVGVLHTRNAALRAAVAQLGYFTPVSNDAQRTLCGLLEDAEWTKRFMVQLRSRLGVAYRATSTALGQASIPHAAANAGIFLWMDLRRPLSASGLGDERAFWQVLFEGSRVNVAFGSAFHAPEPGWFRLCYAQDPTRVARAVSRIRGFLERKGWAPK